MQNEGSIDIREDGKYILLILEYMKQDPPICSNSSFKRISSVLMPANVPDSDVYELIYLNDDGKLKVLARIYVKA